MLQLEKRQRIVVRQPTDMVRKDDLPPAMPLANSHNLHRDSVRNRLPCQITGPCR
jgi:hypothetical protein